MSVKNIVIYTMGTRGHSVSRVFVGQIMLFLDYLIQYNRVRIIISVNIGSSLKNDQILLFITFIDYFHVPAIILIPVNIATGRIPNDNDTIGILFTELIQFVIF